VAKQYNSFLVRTWSLNDATLRIQVEYVQAGRSQRFTSLHHAVEWMVECIDGERPTSDSADTTLQRVERVTDQPRSKR
jgi:hypothetical protein